jgi:hypothetical protein
VDQVKLYGNWFDKEFLSLEIAMTKCDQSTYKGQCKSDKDIDHFLRHNFFYFINQDTLVDPSIYENEAAVEAKKFNYTVSD